MYIMARCSAVLMRHALAIKGLNYTCIFLRILMQFFVVHNAKLIQSWIHYGGYNLPWGLDIITNAYPR